MNSDNKTPYTPAITRRAALTGATAIGMGALPGLGITASAAPLPRASGLELPLTPEENLRNLIRMSASLDPVDTPWFFNGSVYAVVGDQAPVELMRSEGLEIYNMQRRDPASFVMHGLTATFYTHADSGEVLRKFDNPYTGKVVDVSPNAARTPPGGGHVYETTGVRPRSARDDIPDKTLDLWWTAAGDFVWLHNETIYPPGLPQPRKQRQSNFVRIEEFADPDVRSLSAAFTVTFWSPWSSWLGMEGTPGHLVWHASGAKLKSVEDLPAHFRSRMDAEYPDMLAVKIR